MFCVYGLRHPLTKELRYIGASSNYIERYKEHLLPSNLKATTHKINWIKSLLSSNLLPEVFVIEIAESMEDALEKEVDLIEYFRFIGCELTNSTNGGDGRSGFLTSIDVKNKISQSMRGKNTKPEIKANCLHCNNVFYFKAKYLKRGHKFCSLLCANRNRSKNTIVAIQQLHLPVEQDQTGAAPADSANIIP
jgi:hypothetical protein